MNTKFKIMFLCVLWMSIGYSQSLSEKKKAISIIEDLSYTEYYIGTKHITSAKIYFEPETNKIEIIDIFYAGEERNTKTKRSFYVEDIDLESMEYEVRKIEEDKCFVTVRFQAKGNVIEINSVDTNLSKFPYPTSKTQYTDELWFYPVGKVLSEYLAMKYVNNIQVLMGAKNYKEVLFE